MYALTISDLYIINHLQSLCPTVKQVWYTDDATCGHLFWVASMVGHSCCTWTGSWLSSERNQDRPDCQEQFLDKAKHLFEGTNVNISYCARKVTSGSCHLVQKVATLSNMLVIKWRHRPKQSHATYSAFVHELSSRWTHLSRTIPGVSDLFQPLEDSIHQVFI